MLLVIFGAGASFDSSPTYTPGVTPPGASEDDRNNDCHRLPLAKDLFADRPLFRDAIDAFPQCKSIVSRLRHPAVLDGQKSIEAVLQEIEHEAETYRRGRFEMAAVRFYLQRVIRESEKNWLNVIRGITNYLNLLREIDRSSPREPVCLVTFNYDTLLEDALRQLGCPINSIDDYINKHEFWRLFKLHGSTNWSRLIETSISIEMKPAGGTLETERRISAQLIGQLPEMRITNDYVLTPYDAVGIGLGRPAFPAIAIPVENKGGFECPQRLVETLIGLLPRVTKVLVIGWRASETHFLDLLRQYLKSGVHLWVVGRDGPDAERVRVRLEEVLGYEPTSFTAETAVGFTELIRSRRHEQILAA
jgi:hypothetical protein